MTLQPKRVLIPLLMFGLCGLIGACASRPMSVRLNTQDWRDLVQQHFSAGMSAEQVHAELDAMGVARQYRLEYPATAERGPVLLARSYVGGGAFIRGGDSRLEFNDLSFLFDDQGRLTKVYGMADGVRYFDGGPAYGPQRATMRDVDWYPVTIPPPVDPLEKATELPIAGRITD